jgi:hypothetical protein
MLRNKMKEADKQQPKLSPYVCGMLLTVRDIYLLLVYFAINFTTEAAFLENRFW